MAKSEKKIFVLDTSVILYSHDSIMNFDEHDIAIPITVLEELDNFKKGNDTLNFEAREFIRLLDRLAYQQLRSLFRRRGCSQIDISGTSTGNSYLRRTCAAIAVRND